MMIYDALDIAYYVIQWYRNQDDLISNLKLQKILYFIQAEFLVSKDCPCFKDDIVAWGFGPVVIDVYRKFKIFGAASIPSSLTIPKVNMKKEDAEKIDEVLKLLQPYSASSLTDITLSQTPWIKSYKYGKDNIISKKIIKDFFKEEL